MKHLFFKKGLFSYANENDPKKQNGLSFTNLFKRTLKFLGLPYQDPCCDAPTVIPGGFSTNERDEASLYIWNSTTQTFDQICRINIGRILECEVDAGTTINDVVLVNGGIVLGGGGVVAAGLSEIAGFIPSDPVETVNAPGAISADAYLTNLESTGVADAFSLPDGNTPGQLKKIVHYIDGGSAVITPANLSGGTTITMTTVGEFVTMFWNGTDWFVIELGNTATPGTLPVVA